MPGILADRGSGGSLTGLAGLGAVSAGIYGYVALGLPTSNLPGDVALFLGIFGVLFTIYFFAVARVRRLRGDLSNSALAVLVFGFAIVFRLLLVGAGLDVSAAQGRLGGALEAFADDLSGERIGYEPFLLYDNDIWRYLWGGHVVAEGESPYLHGPAAIADDPVLSEKLLRRERWLDVHGLVSFQSYRSVYPPFSQYFFAVLSRLAPGSVAAAKLALVGLDLALCWLLWRVLMACGLSPALTLVYAWNPLVIKEFAGSAHPDVLMMLPLVAAPYLLWRGRSMIGGGALAASALAKVASVAVLPLTALWIWRQAPDRSRGGARRGPAWLAAAGFAGVLVAGAWPMREGLGEWLRALGVFAERWTFNSGAWQAVRWVAEAAGAEDATKFAHLACRALLLLTIAAVAFGSSGRLPGSSWRGALVQLYTGLFLTLAALVLLSPAVMPWYILWALPASVVAGSRSWPVLTALALLSYLTYADGVATLWWKWIEYGLFALAVAWDLTAHRQHRRIHTAARAG